MSIDVSLGLDPVKSAESLSDNAIRFYLLASFESERTTLRRLAVSKKERNAKLSRPEGPKGPGNLGSKHVNIAKARGLREQGHMAVGDTKFQDGFVT